MMEYLCRTWATVSLDAIRHNLNTLRWGLRRDCKVMAVIKADAYGHGDGNTARVLLEAGADWLAVSTVNEGISLRKQGINAPLLLLGYTPPQAAARLAQERMTQAVISPQYARELSAAAVQAGVTVDCHFKLDTGMTRVGFYAQQGHEQEAAQELAQAYTLPGLCYSGVFTHFACADELNADSDAYTRAQYDCFCRVVALAEEKGVSLPLRHCCNSAGAIRFPEMQLEMVRLGIALYGLAPSAEMQPLCAVLRPAMSLYSVVVLVKRVEEDTPVSYGRTYHALGGERRLATIAVGYADGFRRNFGGKGRVIIRGRYAPVVGRVCMDQMIVDVTDIPDVCEGDLVTLVGKQGAASITLDDLAAINHSICYEEACLISRRVPRVYMEAGREIAAVDYLLDAQNPLDNLG